MIEEHKEPPHSPGTTQNSPPDTTNNEWIFFKNQHEEITSHVQVKRSFYNEMKSNAKKVRSNKKNPTKSGSYYSTQSGLASPLNPEKLEDHIYQTAIPNTITYTYEGLGSRLYNCRFTHDGRSVLVTSQTGTSFFTFSEDNQVSLSKVIHCSNINWAITDSDLSSDNKFMVHSTLSPYVHMFDLEQYKYAKQFNIKTGAAQEGEGEDEEEDNDYYWFSSLRVYSLKLSGDNKEIIAGCGRMNRGAPIQVFDINQNKLKHSIVAHREDINSVCYVDKQNSNLFISGSDDGKCKLWDTRCLVNNKPVGIFHGHLAGLTCVTSKGDNRYFISNSKDQSIKLWDLRKAVTEETKTIFMPYDYRYQRPSKANLREIRDLQKRSQSLDQSVMTFEGHAVSGTLIRCHFSPLYGTGQRYIYSGSYDGKVYIFDTVSGEHIASLELPKDEQGSSHVVRDCAWHPFSQNLISTSFNGEIHRWEYMDLRNSKQISEEEAGWETEEEEEDVSGRRGARRIVIEDDEDDDDDDEGEVADEFNENYFTYEEGEEEEDDDESYDPKEDR